jgi:hypothetical protein
VKQGLYWVYTNDRAIFLATYTGEPVYWPEDPHYDPRADFDRNFVINSLDADIIEEYFGKLDVPADCGKKLELTSMTGDCLVPDTNYTIDWYWRIYTGVPPMPGDRDYPGTFRLYYSTDYGGNWIVIDTVSGVTFYEWLVPLAVSDQCWLRIDDVCHQGLTDVKTWVHPLCTEPLSSDLNDDCYVNFFDFAILAAVWLDEGGTDIDDLVEITSMWLDCTNPCDPLCGE